MDEMVNRGVAAFARLRILTYLNCMQATYSTLAGYLGVSERTAVRAGCPLEGGGASEGSTCGVVSGGCMAVVLAHLGDILEGEAGKGEALYGRLREYTAWFEESFGSTLCRERSGLDLNELLSFMDYLFTGKVFTRCVNHIGRAVSHLIELMNRPLEGGGEASAIDLRLASGGGYCAAEVLKGLREETGLGSLFLERMSVALDGGVGLSGGLCGALGAALLAMGLVWGIDPRKEGLVGTLVPFVRGHVNLYAGRSEPELWAVANPFMREFRKRYGSLECRDLTGCRFGSGSELAEHVESSESCAQMKEWCRTRAAELISSHTVFAT
ncbi:MAG: C_GCAxxG_C_C family protein [Actinobacteria bacterium]|nr:C_GCAxxG_C_C family protein [Actinomycetota bacterium]MDI6831762.1 C-GCAxxG-C-C family protein [Actinomycetota bacterium]